MTGLALDPKYRRITVEEFLAMDLGDGRAELDDGLIYMMAGGSARHAAVSRNILIALAPRLRGSGCQPYGSDMAVRTGRASVRLPDASVYCGNPDNPENDRRQLLGDPVVIFEVLSDSTSTTDQREKLDEYRQLEGVDAIVFVDTEKERIRLVERTSASGWSDLWLAENEDLKLAKLDIELPRAEIFARD